MAEIAGVTVHDACLLCAAQRIAQFTWCTTRRPSTTSLLACATAAQSSAAAARSRTSCHFRFSSIPALIEHYAMLCCWTQRRNWLNQRCLMAAT
jgi:hypothetical protein